MSKPSIHIGTSGWNYNHWKGPFYPEDLPTKKWLDFYTGRFHTVEINNTFYQLPKEETFEQWRDETPDHFVFSVKASRYITHMKKLKDPQQSLANFLERVKILGGKLGPILFQLPPKWNFNPDRLDAFLKELPKDFCYTFEFRDDSWWDEAALEALKAHNAAFCIFDLAGKLSPKEITADFVYIRLHGPGGAYQGQYDNQTLSGWAGAFSAWQRQGKQIYCYFDNDQNGYATLNAQSLQEMI